MADHNEDDDKRRSEELDQFVQRKLETASRVNYERDAAGNFHEVPNLPADGHVSTDKQARTPRRTEPALQPEPFVSSCQGYFRSQSSPTVHVHPSIPPLTPYLFLPEST